MPQYGAGYIFDITIGLTHETIVISLLRKTVHPIRPGGYPADHFLAAISNQSGHRPGGLRCVRLG